jgi:serine/threonine protein kinase
MKAGDTIGGYLVVTEPTNAGGGKCVWAFAEKDGREFFLKRFLEPKRPREGGGGSAESRRIRMETCRHFEDRHQAVMELLRPDAPGAGNLVLATDFFHEGSTYYKVTERIDTSSLDEPHTLDARQKAVLLKTLGTSLRMLHAIDVVHGDLKPANVLVQKRAEAAFHTAKLIDFDDSYVAKEPPAREEIAGDSLYGAPEWRRYMQGDESVQGGQLTAAVDVFALGLMAHSWLTGALPAYDERFGSPADAVNAGEPLGVDPRLSPPTLRLVTAMTAADPAVRPTAEAFVAALKDPEVCALGEPRRESRLRFNLPRGSNAARVPGPSVPADAAPAAATEGAATGAGTAGPAESHEPAEPAAHADPTDTAPPPKSRVRINLGGRSGHRPTP